MKKNYIYLALSFFILISGCSKDINQSITISEFEHSAKLIEDNFVIGVYSEEGEPIYNAIITINKNTYHTDNNGLHFFQKIELLSSGTLVKIESPGYFTSLKRLYPGKRTLEVRMKSLGPPAFLDNNTGGTIKIQDLEYNFPSNSLTTIDGKLYQGQVSIYSSFLDGSEQNKINQFGPGDQRGIDLSNSPKALSTYGMFETKLIGSNGEELKVKEGVQVLIRIPLKDEIESKASNITTTWYFDEALGVWREDAKAQKVNNFYEFSVTHFTWWTCAKAFEWVTLKLRCIDQNGNPVPNIFIAITLAEDSSFCSGGITGLDGMVSGIIPKDKNLVAKFYFDCKCILNELKEIPISESSNDIDLGDIQLELKSGNTIIQGQIFDCIGAPASNKLVRLMITDGFMSHYEYVTSDNEGNYKFEYPCSLAGLYAILKGIDLENDKDSKNSFEKKLIQGDNIIDNLFICSPLEEYIDFKYKNTVYKSDQVGFSHEASLNDNLFGGIIYHSNLDKLEISMIFEGSNFSPGKEYNIFKFEFDYVKDGYHLTGWKKSGDAGKILITKVHPNGKPAEGTYTAKFDYFAENGIIELGAVYGGSFKMSP